MSRLARKIRFALAGLVGGFAVACSAPTEAPPMGPRPEPVQPASSPTDPTSPVPGAPSPIDDPPAPLDGGVSSVTAIDPVVIAPAPGPKQKTPGDAGVADAASPPPPVDAQPPRDAGIPLPPVADGGLPADASRRAD